MSLAVVRCPACRGLSRVASEELGGAVACPRCQSPFVAVEEAQLVTPRPVPAPAPERTTAARPVAPPPRRRRNPRDDRDEPFTSRPVAVPVEPVPDLVHDPHQKPVAGLPVSVLVGLALLPFGIPLLWLITPALTGLNAALSMAVPISLAVAASALCLGVVKTIDWSATTRIKGVLMLVSLSYFAAAGLYFLKKDLTDKVQGFFGPTSDWSEEKSKDGQFKVKLPSNRWETPKDIQPLDPRVKLQGLSASHNSPIHGNFEYFALYGDPAVPLVNPDDAWFDGIGTQLKQGKGVKQSEKPRWVPYTPIPNLMGREWEFRLQDGNTRIVRVFVIRGRVYYLSAEGPNLDNRDELARTFFDSFLVN